MSCSYSSFLLSILPSDQIQAGTGSSSNTAHQHIHVFPRTDQCTSYCHITNPGPEVLRPPQSLATLLLYYLNPHPPAPRHFLSGVNRNSVRSIPSLSHLVHLTYPTPFLPTDLLLQPGSLYLTLYTPPSFLSQADPARTALTCSPSS